MVLFHTVKLGKWIRRWGRMALLLIVLPSTLLGNNLSSDREEAIKASFLMSFRDFIHWNSIELKEKNRFYIGVWDDAKFHDLVRHAVRNKPGMSKKVVVRQFQSLEDLESVHMLYLKGVPPGSLEDILEHCSEKGIVTVGEMDGFVENGGVIQFVKRGNRLRFRINLDAAKMADVRISSKLIRLSER